MMLRFVFTSVKPSVTKGIWEATERALQGTGLNWMTLKKFDTGASE